MLLRHDVACAKPSSACVATLLALSSWLALPDAHAADDREICVRAVEHAQLVRLDGKLREAREGFVTCARPVCPDAIQEDCTRWLAEVEESLPSVVFDAVWIDGRDVTGMTVLVDGKLLAGAERGRAVALDPGEHTFRFEVTGAAPVETRNVIREGEKNRMLHVTFTPNVPAPPVTPAPTAAPAPPVASHAPAPDGLWQPIPSGEGAAHRQRGPVPPSGLVFGGMALASFGAFAFLGLTGTDQLDSMRSSCGHTCNPSDVSSARNEILAGDILGFVGLAAAGLAVWFVLTRPDAPVAASTR
jgi:hypothetical protein